MPVALLSDQNGLIKQIRRAVSRGGLTEDGFAVAEGAHLVEEARSAKCEIGAVVAAESAVAFHEGARVVSDKAFRALSSTETPQGVLALVRIPRWELGQMLAGQALLIVLDGIQDPGNAGAILRAAEAFGASGAVFLKGSVNPYHPRCLRGSAGSLFRLPVVAGIDENELLDGLQQIRLYAAMPRAGTPLSQANCAAPCAVVIGGEGRGVSPALEKRATGLRIPTAHVESLNAAVAAGVILYEASRQRGSR